MSSKFLKLGKPMRILRQREAPTETALCRRRRRRAPVRSLIDWLRAGYPDEAPRTGYSPLLALNGPIALSRKQIRQVLDRLATGIYDKTDIEVAITGATGRLPTPPQLRQVVAALTSRGTKRSR
jgi:Protein of unknown function (DUF3349)